MSDNLKEGWVAPWIGVDFDGTLATYHKWRGAEHVGEPIMPMVERVQRWLAEGKAVRIFTARVSAPPGDERRADEAAISRMAIDQFCIEHFGKPLPITNVKDFAMVELWDDRAVTVEANTGRALAPSTRGND